MKNAKVFSAICSVLVSLGLAACASPSPTTTPVQTQPSARTNDSLPAALDCKPPEKEVDHLVVSLPTDAAGAWKVGNAAKNPSSSIMEFIRADDDINRWRELFTVQTVAAGPEGMRAPADALDLVRAMHERQCPGAFRWNVVASKDIAVVYEWQATRCRGWPDQHEIASIINGKYSQFFVRYTAKVYRVAPDVRAEWIERLTNTKVVLRCH